MSILLYFLKAWVIGIAVAASVGPIGMLCIRKTLELGLRGAIAVGMGAALADSAYGLVAATGLTVVSLFLLEKAVLIQMIGGGLLLVLAYKELTTPSATEINIKKSKGLGSLTFTVFFLTLANPLTILSFIGIFASISGGPIGVIEALLMVVGVFLGSMTWWLFLGAVILKIKHKLPAAWLNSIRYLSALILAGFGIVSLSSGLLQ